jgi:hypothetical protein
MSEEIIWVNLVPNEKSQQITIRLGSTPKS